MAGPVSHALAAPSGGVYRVAASTWPFELRRPHAPLAPSSVPVLAGNRWDDPQAIFKTLYCASDAEGAFAETIARYREAPGLMDRIDAFLSGSADAEYDPVLHVGRIPEDYFDSRYLGHVEIDSDVRFVDLDHPDTDTAARPLLKQLRPFGIKKIDRTIFLSPDRRVTRTIARYYWELAQLPDHARWRGLRFLSRLASHWECWAIWEPSPLRTAQSHVAPVTRTDPALLSAARALGVELP